MKYLCTRLFNPLVWPTRGMYKCYLTVKGRLRPDERPMLVICGSLRLAFTSDIVRFATESPDSYLLTLETLAEPFDSIFFLYFALKRNR